MRNLKATLLTRQKEQKTFRLEAQQVLVLLFQSKIEKVREIQQRGYVRGAGDASEFVLPLNTKTLASLDAADSLSGKD